MSFAPEEEILGQQGINLAPMIDFLFLMLMFFACLAVSRITTRDTDLELVEIQPDRVSQASGGDSDTKLVHLTITADGGYKWVTEIRDHYLDSPDEIYAELIQQYDSGQLPSNKELTQVLLKIDRAAQWDPILRAIFAVRQAGFEVRPVYEPLPESGAAAAVPLSTR